MTMNASTLSNLQVERVVAREFATVTSLLRIHWQFLSPGNYSVIASKFVVTFGSFLVDQWSHISILLLYAVDS